MLDVYAVMLEVLGGLRGELEKIEVRDADLARQLRRAGASVVLNLAEGSGSFGGNRRLRYRNALGSAKETRAALDASVALGYAKLDAQLAAKLQHVVSVLVKVSR